LYDGTKEGLQASLQCIQQTAQTILNGIQHDGASDGEGYDKESPHQARGSQKLTVDSRPPAPAPIGEQQIVLS
jgi:hypothetical protein